MRRFLVVGQVALSLILLVGALLFARSLVNLLTLDPGILEKGLLVTFVDLERLGYPASERHAIFQRVLERLRATPGVESAAASFIVPLSGFGWNDNILPGDSDSDSADGEARKFLSNFNEVTDGYFTTVGTPLLAGRDFDSRDLPLFSPVAIVDESFAARLVGPEKNPIGARFAVREGRPGQPPTVYQIVGLVQNAKYESLRSEFGPTVFRAASQQPDAQVATNFLVRSRLPASSLVPTVEHAVAEVEPRASMQFQVFEDKTKESLARERLMATLSLFFGVLAGLLAAIGLYGTLSYTVARRRNEIGIRVALGADRRTVMTMVLKEASALLIGGLVAGAVGSLLLGRAAQSLLFGLSARDPVTIASAAALLASVGVAASLAPARRASRVEPGSVLNED